MACNQVIEKFGMYFDEIGLNKTYGRMFGIFMTTTEPISMGKLVEQLNISKSTASTELRRLLSMGVVEKVLLSDERADFYQLRKNIWAVNLRQKIEDIKKLQSIVEEIPAVELDNLEHLKSLSDYCSFLEPELVGLAEKYMKRGSTSGSYRTKDQKSIIEWAKISALSDAFAEKMKELSQLGIDAFTPVEVAFLSEYPRAVEEDQSLRAFYGLQGRELELAVRAKLEKIFLAHPKAFTPEMRAGLAGVYYYVVTIRDAMSGKTDGFIAFMGGGSMSKTEFKITVLAVDERARRAGLAGLLVHSLCEIGVPYTKIFASTRPTNVAAIRAYKKWGFSEEALKNAPTHFVSGHWVHLVCKGAETCK